jgi:hypothetical protein
MTANSHSHNTICLFKLHKVFANVLVHFCKKEKKMALGTGLCLWLSAGWARAARSQDLQALQAWRLSLACYIFRTFMFMK